MPDRQPIPLAELQLPSFTIFDKVWFLLTAGELGPGRFNTMTVSWGSLGTMWHKPFAQVVVRPTRHTFGFIDGGDTFTLCAFGEAHRPALKLCGTRSGRDMDKVAAAGLTPIASSAVAAPSFDEAELIIECRKMYWQDLDPTNFLAEGIDKLYADKDYHRAVFGEVLAVHGTAAFRRQG